MVRRLVFSGLALALAGAAWSFDLVEGYSISHITSASDEGGSILLGGMNKIAPDDPVLADFAALVHTSFDGNIQFAVGDEIAGTWTVDQFDATLYPPKSYGSTFGSRIESSGFPSDIRFVWLSELDDQGPYCYFSGEQYWLYPQIEEPNHRNGTNVAGPYDYEENVNMGFGYWLTDEGVHSQNHWLLLYQDGVDPLTGMEQLSFRGGVHYSERVVTNAVPEPVSFLALSGLSLMAIRRKRAR